MALSNYTELKAAVLDWMVRSGQTGQVADWITLAEARLNRELDAVATDGALTGVADSRRIDVSSLAIVEPIALFLAKTDMDEIPVQIQADGTFPYLANSGEPGIASFDGTNIDFDRPLDQAYPFRLRYLQRFSLSDAAPTNWLLTNNPDIYLAATIMWGAGYNEDWANGQVWKAILDQGIPSVAHQIARSKRGVLRVDPALSAVGRSTCYDLVNNG